jgi:hypothetical protein
MINTYKKFYTPCLICGPLTVCSGHDPGAVFNYNYVPNNDDYKKGFADGFAEGFKLASEMAKK